jgi:hypothetical protein
MFKVEPVAKKVSQFKQKRLNHVSRIEVVRLSQQLDYRPTGRRPGRPLKRPVDGYNREAETGHLWVKLRDQKKKINKTIW